MAASPLSLFSSGPVRKKIVLPISEAFANILFEGREHTVNVAGAGDGTHRLLFNNRPDLLTRLRNTSALGWIYSVDVRDNLSDLYYLSKKEINEEKSKVVPKDNSRIYIDRNDRSIMFIYSSHANSSVHDAVYEFYGEWDDSGPRLVFKRLYDRIFYPTLKTMNRFIERLKAIDEWIAGEPDITVRITEAKPEVEAGDIVFDPSRGTPGIGVRPNLRNTGIGRSGLPENVLQNVLLPMIQNRDAKKNIAKPLSRLVKGGRSRKVKRVRKSKSSYSRKAL